MSFPYTEIMPCFECGRAGVESDHVCDERPIESMFERRYRELEDRVPRRER